MHCCIFGSASCCLQASCFRIASHRQHHLSLEDSVHAQLIIQYSFSTHFPSPMSFTVPHVICPPVSLSQVLHPSLFRPCGQCLFFLCIHSYHYLVSHCCLVTPVEDKYHSQGSSLLHALQVWLGCPLLKQGLWGQLQLLTPEQ